MFSFCVGIIALSLLGLLAGIILGYAASRFHNDNDSDPLIETIDNVLPQSQCAQCGYPGCRPYAEAIANGEAINKCISGGEPLMLKLAEIMAIEPQYIKSDTPATPPERHIVYINESDCIGCTKCAKICPVDAIVGSNKLMHTVISDLCTGCDLCISPCPMDCIEKHAITITPSNWKWDLALPITQLEEHSND